MTSTRLEILFNKYLQRSATSIELQELGNLLQQADAEEQLSPQLQTLWNTIKEQNIQYPVDWDTIYNSIIAETPVRKMWTWKRWVAAASILFIVGLGSYFAFFNSRHSGSDRESIAKTDIKAPDKSRASITLADGRIIYLDSLNTGTIATQNEIVVTKDAQGNIVYTGSAIASEAKQTVFNTLSNPRGSKVIDMTLSDGSHVWLNAGSSITYPIAFTGNERKITMTGEGYFEITHNASKPFYVSLPSFGGAGGGQVEVLGTHFNVNAYDDESDIKVTLLEGSVKTSNSKGSVILKPGQQARITSNIQPLTSNSVDLEKTMAWKNNDFIFDEDNLEDIMRQLSRWYNINPVFTQSSAAYNVTNYTGRITRTVPISQVLDLFEKIGYVKFEINGNDVKIIPVK